MMGLSCPSSLLMATMRSKGSGGCTVGAHVNTLAAAGLLLGALSQTRGPHVRRERLGQLVVAQPKLQQARAQRRRQRACCDTSEHYCKSVEGVAAPAAPLSAGARSVLLHRRSWLRARESASRAARAADMCEHGDTAAHIARCAALQPAAPAWLRTARNAASAQRTRRMAPQPAGSGGEAQWERTANLRPRSASCAYGQASAAALSWLAAWHLETKLREKRILVPPAVIARQLSGAPCVAAPPLHARRSWPRPRRCVARAAAPATWFRLAATARALRSQQAAAPPPGCSRAARPPRLPTPRDTAHQTRCAVRRERQHAQTPHWHSCTLQAPRSHLASVALSHREAFPF